MDDSNTIEFSEEMHHFLLSRALRIAKECKPLAPSNMLFMESLVFLLQVSSRMLRSDLDGDSDRVNDSLEEIVNLCGMAIADLRGITNEQEILQCMSDLDELYVAREEFYADYKLAPDDPNDSIVVGFGMCVAHQAENTDAGSKACEFILSDRAVLDTWDAIRKNLHLIKA